MIKRLISITCLLLSLTNYAQVQEEQSNTHIPTSIFSIANQIKSENTTHQLNKTLGLDSFQFIKIDERIIDTGLFVIDYENLGRVATTYVYQSFNKPNPNKYMFTGFELSRLIHGAKQNGQIP